MPDRIIRDELLSSDRWLGMARNTHRLAFLCLLLDADALGNVDATDGHLWRLWRDPLRLDARSAVPEIIEALVTADLARMYEADGRRHLHIPRYRQRLRYINGKHPRPPSHIECNEIKHMLEKRQAAVGPQSGASRTTAVEEKRSEVKRSTTKPARANAEAVDKSAATNTTATPQVNTIVKKLTNGEGPKPRSRDDQLAYVKAQTRQPAEPQ